MDTHGWLLLQRSGAMQSFFWQRWCGNRGLPSYYESGLRMEGLFLPDAGVSIRDTQMTLGRPGFCRAQRSLCSLLAAQSAHYISMFQITKHYRRTIIEGSIGHCACCRPSDYMVSSSNVADDSKIYSHRGIGPDSSFYNQNDGTAFYPPASMDISGRHV